MKNVVVAGVIATFLGLSSCHKEYIEINQTEPDLVLTDSLINTNQNQDEIVSYFPLSVGNYWIYEQYEFDENGNQVGETGLDSIVVVSTEMLDGEQKFVVEFYEHPFQKQTKYLSNLSLFAKDSVDNNLNKILTLDVLETSSDGDTLMYMSKYMTESPNTIINIPAGQFQDLLRYNITIHYEDQGVVSTKDGFAEYALGVGKVHQKYFYASTYPKQYFERKLLKYHVK